MDGLAAARWIENAADYSIDIAALLGGFAALLAVASAVRSRYRRTLGRRRDRYDRLARLGVGAQLRFFAAVHGEPPAIRRTITKPAYAVATPDHPMYDPAQADEVDEVHDVLVDRSYEECIFIDPLYYLQTVSDGEESVMAFSVTTRSRRFKPTFEAPSGKTLVERIRWRRQVGEPYEPLFRVRLGRTRFADLDPEDPDDFAGPHLRVWTGVRTFSYTEFYYYGNPGYYRSFAFTGSSAARGPADWKSAIDLREQIGFNEWPYPFRPDPDETEPPDPDTSPGWETLTAAHALRRRTAITTITVIHSDLWTANYPTTFGPHGDEVRLLP